VRVLDLFAGIGGFSLGLERAGMRTVAFCEIDAYCREILARHWPGIPCYADVRRLTAARLAADGVGAVDVVCGGFPCQDVSNAGTREGLAGERSGLWREFARLLGELRPRYAIVENVSALLGRGFDCVLGDLAALGFDAEWHCIPASYVGAPHRRDRVWVVAYANSEALRLDQQWVQSRRQHLPHSGDAKSCEHGEPQPLADTHAERCECGRQSQRAGEPRACGCEPHRCGVPAPGADPDRDRLERSLAAWASQRQAFRSAHGRHPSWWEIEPDVGRVVDGIPDWVERLSALGNAVVPAIAELIGAALMQGSIAWTKEKPSRA